MRRLPLLSTYTSIGVCPSADETARITGTSFPSLTAMLLPLSEPVLPSETLRALFVGFARTRVTVTPSVLRAAVIVETEFSSLYAFVMAFYAPHERLVLVIDCPFLVVQFSL